MSQQGYIKLYRKIEESELYFCEKFSKVHAWIDLLLLANHKNGIINIRGNIININRGQVGYSKDTLAKRWKWSKQKVYTFLELLEKLGQIDYKISQQTRQQKNNILGLITIKNYDFYQSDIPQDIPQTRQQTRQQKDHRLDTNKNDKNDKNDKNEKEDNITPKNIMIKFLNSEEEQTKQTERLSKQYNISLLEADQQLDKFISYWEEKTKNGLKQRWELEKTWDVDRRLNTWILKSIEFRNNKFNKN